MIGSAYIKEKKMYLQYVMDDFGTHAGIEYDLGQNLLDFLWFDMDNMNRIYTELCVFMQFPYYGKSDEEFGDKLCETIDNIDLYCPYLHFYTQALLKFIVDSAKLGQGAYAQLFSFAEDAPKYCDDDELYVKNKNMPFLPDEYMSRLHDLQISPSEVGPFTRLLKDSDNARRILMEDMQNKRNKLKSSIDQIVDYNQDSKGKNDLLPLMKIDSERVKKGEKPYFIGHTFQSEFLPANIKVPNDGESLDWNLNYEKYGIVQMYKIESIDDLIRFELLHLVNQKILIKKCKYCGHYFVPRGRSDTEYCNRVYVGETRSCKEIGAMQNYKAKIAGDKINEAYNKAYKRNNSRVRNKKMSQSDFLKWSEQARKMRNDCHANKIGFEEFQQWLNKK